MNGVKKKKEGMKVKVKDVNGAVLMEGEKVQKRSTDYYEQLLSVDEREAKTSTLRRMNIRGSK